MANLNNLFQKAVYLGVGLASVATEAASAKLADLKEQARKVTDDLVTRGEMTAEQAQKYMDDLVASAQKQVSAPTKAAPGPEPRAQAPRPIEILDDEGESAEPIDALRQQLQDLEAELQRLRQEP